MLTLQQALALKYRNILLHVTHKDSTGNPSRCRVNGAVKTWKTRPGKFCIPVKYGLRDCFYITQDIADQWQLPDRSAPAPVFTGNESDEYRHEG